MSKVRSPASWSRSFDEFAAITGVQARTIDGRAAGALRRPRAPALAHAVMCTLAVYVRCTPALPLLVAANRDEFLDRPTADPRLLAADPWVVGGQDLSAGGTWFGVNGAGMVVGLLNRRRPAGPIRAPAVARPALTSRCCRQPGLAAARRTPARRSDGGAYNAFNLLVADRARGLRRHQSRRRHRRSPRSTRASICSPTSSSTIPPARASPSRRQRFRALDLRRRGRRRPTLLPDLRTILADHSTALDPRADVIDTLCVHLPGYGTRSSSIVAAVPPGACATGMRRVRPAAPSTPRCSCPGLGGVMPGRGGPCGRTGGDGRPAS